MSYPVSLEQRVASSKTIVKASVINKVSFKDKHGNIYTNNFLRIKDILKGDTGLVEINAITIGGEIGNEMQISYPAVQLNIDQDYVLFLEEEKKDVINIDLKKSNSILEQCLIYTDAQGTFQLQNDQYYDVLNKRYYTEKNLFPLIQKFNDGKPQKNLVQNQNRLSDNNINASVAAISSFSPNTTNGGTVNAGDYITITGSGFGATRGTNEVYFANVNDGGASYVAPYPSDYVSWADNSITVKVPESAGTGLINVAGTFSSSNLTVNYTHTSVNSNFSGFGTTTRQKYYFRNKNGSGGYTFRPNSTSGFSGNTSAVTTLQDAMTTWSCNTGMNWDIGTSTTTTFGSDNENVVLFDASLPAGVLGRLTSRFLASSSGGCSGVNTVWWLDEMDMQIKPDPPVTGYSWEYGPSNPSSSKYDLESVMLHELGHAHGLGHRIAPGQTMHYALFNGVATRSLDANEINAGIARINYSTATTCFNPSGSGTPMTALTCSSSVLPVELLFFDADKEEEKVVVSWTTVSEFNNDFFTIEKSSNGIDFIPVGISDAAGNSNNVINYSLIDENPYIGINYYRLKQTDFDGNFTYSYIVRVDFEQDSKQEIFIYPNPANDIITINTNEKITEGIISIFNVNGAEVYFENVSSTVDTYQKKINISNLSNGIYLMKYTTNGKSFISKMVKN